MREHADPVDQLRCVIVDDDPSFLAAARALLEADGVTVAGTASTVASAVQQVDELRPNVVLIDIRLGRESGFTEVDYADLLAESPVIGFLPKVALSGPAIERILAR
jgi:DNA-binding NarL/FixJ family response regulator